MAAKTSRGLQIMLAFFRVGAATDAVLALDPESSGAMIHEEMYGKQYRWRSCLTTGGIPRGFPQISTCFHGDKGGRYILPDGGDIGAIKLASSPEHCLGYPPQDLQMLGLLGMRGSREPTARIQIPLNVAQCTSSDNQLFVLPSSGSGFIQVAANPELCIGFMIEYFQNWKTIPVATIEMCNSSRALKFKLDPELAFGSLHPATAQLLGQSAFFFGCFVIGCHVLLRLRHLAAAGWCSGALLAFRRQLQRCRRGWLPGKDFSEAACKLAEERRLEMARRAVSVLTYFVLALTCNTVLRMKSAMTGDVNDKSFMSSTVEKLSGSSVLPQLVASTVLLVYGAWPQLITGRSLDLTNVLFSATWALLYLTVCERDYLFVRLMFVPMRMMQSLCCGNAVLVMLLQFIVCGIDVYALNELYVTPPYGQYTLQNNAGGQALVFVTICTVVWMVERERLEAAEVTLGNASEMQACQCIRLESPTSSTGLTLQGERAGSNGT